VYEIIRSAKPNFCESLVAIFTEVSVVYVLTNVRRVPNYKRRFASFRVTSFGVFETAANGAAGSHDVRLRCLLGAGSKVRLNYNPGNDA